jgi:hypothetical protein
VLAVIDGPQQVRAQQFSQLPGIDSVTFAALFQIVIATWITHHKLRDMRLQQVIQPRSPSAIAKRDERSLTVRIKRFRLVARR